MCWRAVKQKSNQNQIVVLCLDSIIPLLAIDKISRLASLCRWAGRFESYLVTNPNNRFSHDVAHVIWFKKGDIHLLLHTVKEIASKLNRQFSCCNQTGMHLISNKPNPTCLTMSFLFSLLICGGSFTPLEILSSCFSRLRSSYELMK